MATFDNSVDETVITLGTQFVPFQTKPNPKPGALVTVSTSAKALILIADKFAVGRTQARLPSTLPDNT